MKGKLIKTVDGYELFTQGFLKGSTNHGLIESLNIEEGPIRYRLSLKNCQAIEQNSPTEEYILEVNGDGWDDHSYKGKRKQTEWDVEILEECLDKNCDGINKKGECITTGKPKLDEEGCLILKKL